MELAYVYINYQSQTEELYEHPQNDENLTHVATLDVELTEEDLRQDTEGYVIIGDVWLTEDTKKKVEIISDLEYK